MNRFISVGLAIALAPAILLQIGRLADRQDVIAVSEMALYKAALPIGAVFVAIGVLSIVAKRGRRHGSATTVKRRLSSALARGRRFVAAGIGSAGRLSGGQWLLVSMTLCIVALFLPFASGASNTPGWIAVLFGWIAFGSGVFAWCAIPLLLLTWFFLALMRPRLAIVLASAALLLTLPLMGRPMITFGWGEFTHSEPFRPHVGYFIW